ncbi:hypothetical protein QN357_18480 [Cryobacterium sp. RTC2.1]|uniref:hypothetical protein n=1 Tax=Cryobacterium sp. RTC2.1 TaxID=3048634 RepID=UPI002B238B93|nr:hypothetical protein [Cryobacterium sp. RTC2.1]MEB0004907.1 hypothetical protein [Cryobacterium sp. RTC2.1]
MIEPTYALSWPRELFEWAASRILDSEREFPKAKIALLLEEAFDDDDVAGQFLRMGTGSFGWDFEVPPTASSAQDWFVELLKDESRLQPFRRPLYWAQRYDTDLDGGTDISTGFAGDFLDLINKLSETGYIPKVLPKWCPDADNPSDEWVSQQISTAIRIRTVWPELIRDPDTASDALLFSLVEYFHDQAQRPSTFTVHDYAGCGRHYEGYDAVAGRAIYRWRVNQLLRDHNISLQLAANGEEQGRLIREFSAPLQELVTEQLEARQQPQDEIAHAIRDFRSRGASLVAKRAAVTLIANNLEARRKTLKALVSDDENDLFNIANNFAIRHRNPSQKTDYGDQFLDWIFWNFLAATELLDALERRGSGLQ